jgi:segregation and condensation protein B
MAEGSLPIMLEAVLFAAARPMSAAELAAVVDAPADKVRAELKKLSVTMGSTGIHLAINADKYVLVTSPEAADAVRKFLQEDVSSDLSKPALETLAIVAYRGPVTKHQIDTIRGVASDAMIRNLVSRALIEEAGRTKEPGRPMTYRVTHTFLQSFGLTSTDQLPQLPEAPRED